MMTVKDYISYLFRCRSFECRFYGVCPGYGHSYCFNVGYDVCNVYTEDRCQACEKLWSCNKSEARRCRRGDKF